MYLFIYLIYTLNIYIYISIYNVSTKLYIVHINPFHCCICLKMSAEEMWLRRYPRFESKKILDDNVARLPLVPRLGLVFLLGHHSWASRGTSLVGINYNWGRTCRSPQKKLVVDWAELSSWTQGFPAYWSQMESLQLNAVCCTSFLPLELFGNAFSSRPRGALFTLRHSCCSRLLSTGGGKTSPKGFIKNEHWGFLL